MGVVFAAGALFAVTPAFAQSVSDRYVEARRSYNELLDSYWGSVTEKRRERNAKRRRGEAIVLEDYVLVQPPVYSGPPRPPDFASPRDPDLPKPEIPVIADFLRYAAAHYGFVPDPPASELAFKQAYARAAVDLGLTREQVVGIYVFETGGNGTYDTQAGISPQRPGSRAISPALGYNQLLATNTVGMLAEHGDHIVKTLRQRALQLAGEARGAMERKIEVLRRMVSVSRTVPFAWSEHDKLAKSPAGLGIHAVLLDRDIGPQLQAQKLANSVRFARKRGYPRPLTAAELEMLNFTGDGNGYDLVSMPLAMRPLVPTTNFFQQGGYERNTIARKAGTVAGLFAAIESKMDLPAQAQGARDLAAAF